MGKLLHLPVRSQDKAQIVKLKEVSDQIDVVILEALHDKDVSAHELAGLLAHRLGTLMRPIDEKSQLWDICEKVLKKQAVIDQ